MDRKKVEPILESFCKKLGECYPVFMVVGDFRREKNNISGIEIVIKKSARIKEQIDDNAFFKELFGKNFTVLGDHKKVLVEGKYKKIKFMLYLVSDEFEGAMVLYYTGNNLFIYELKLLARKKDLFLSEYGLYDNNGKQMKYLTEDSILVYLTGKYVEPKDRNVYPLG